MRLYEGGAPVDPTALTADELADSIAKAVENA